MSDSLRPHELQHARPSCPSPTPGFHSDSRPWSGWCHLAISSSVISLSSCPQYLPASESFPMSQLFAWGGQSTGVSALASFLPKKSQGWFPSEWIGWISLQSKYSLWQLLNTEHTPAGYNSVPAQVQNILSLLKSLSKNPRSTHFKKSEWHLIIVIQYSGIAQFTNEKVDGWIAFLVRPCYLLFCDFKSPFLSIFLDYVILSAVFVISLIVSWKSFKILNTM